MAINVPQPLINGFYTTHSEILIYPIPRGQGVLGALTAIATIAADAVGIPLEGSTGLRELNYGDQMPPNLVYANDAAPIGRTRGQYSAHASMTLLLPQFYAFIALLYGPNPVRTVGYGEIAFDITVRYLIGDETNPFVNAELIGCRIGNVGTSSSAGSQDPVSKVLDLHPMFIKENGNLLFSGNIAQGLIDPTNGA